MKFLIDMMQHIFQSPMGLIALTILGVLFSWQLTIERRLFVYESWQTTTFWMVSLVGWGFISWQTAFRVYQRHLIYMLLTIFLLMTVLVLILMARGRDSVERQITGLGLALVLFGVIGSAASARTDLGLAILLGSLGGVIAGQAIAGLLFELHILTPPVVHGKTVERI